MAYAPPPQQQQYQQPMYVPMQPVVPMSQQWLTPLCGCFEDTTSCCDFICCPFCSVARQWDAVAGKNDSMNVLICLVNCCFGVTICTNCQVRFEVVRRFGIAESGCLSCLIGWICAECSACQTYRELARRGAWPGGTCCVGQPPQPPPMMVMGQAPPMAGVPLQSTPYAPPPPKQAV